MATRATCPISSRQISLVCIFKCLCVWQCSGETSTLYAFQTAAHYQCHTCCCDSPYRLTITGIIYMRDIMPAGAKVARASIIISLPKAPRFPGLLITSYLPRAVFGPSSRTTLGARTSAGMVSTKPRFIPGPIHGYFTSLTSDVLWRYSGPLYGLTTASDHLIYFIIATSG